MTDGAKQEWEDFSGCSTSVLYFTRLHPSLWAICKDSSTVQFTRGSDGALKETLSSSSIPASSAILRHSARCASDVSFWISTSVMWRTSRPTSTAISTRSLKVATCSKEWCSPYSWNPQLSPKPERWSV